MLLLFRLFLGLNNQRASTRSLLLVVDHRHSFIPFQFIRISNVAYAIWSSSICYCISMKLNSKWCIFCILLVHLSHFHERRQCFLRVCVLNFKVTIHGELQHYQLQVQLMHTSSLCFALLRFALESFNSILIFLTFWLIPNDPFAEFLFEH